VLNTAFDKSVIGEVIKTVKTKSQLLFSPDLTTVWICGVQCLSPQI
jgi:hypothetical protein